MNLEQKAKLGFFESFIKSCISLNFYPQFLRASWLHIILHSLVLITLSTIAYSIAFHTIIEKPVRNLVQEVPPIQIEDGQATWSAKLKTPYIRRIPPQGARRFYYIIDSGKNQRQLEKQYPMYALFTPYKFILNDGHNRQEASLKNLTKNNAFLENFFGKPMIIDQVGLSKFISFYVSITFGLLFFFLPLLFLFPLGNLLVSIVANIYDKWSVPFVDIFKLSFFAATPPCLVLIFGCLFLMLNWTILLLSLTIAFIVQVAYLVTGLKAYKFQ